MNPLLEEALLIALSVGGALLIAFAVAHAVLRVRDSRAAAGWVAVVLALPLAGALLYWIFGINRIRRRAALLLRERDHAPPGVDSGALPTEPSTSGLLQPIAHPDLVHALDHLTTRPLTYDNLITPLCDGDEAYPAMLAAIDAAQDTVLLATYIFDRDPVGLRFVDALARGISDGPDHEGDALKWALCAALACAKHRVRIATPSFLPEGELITALITAALRGVSVEVLLPATNNQALVAWAADAILPELIQRGVIVWKTEGPFDHSKVVLVDESWSFIGSANLDPRSLRLNFEFNVSCHDAALATALHRILDAKREGARLETLTRLTAKDWRSRLRRVRSGLARLFVPYL